VAVSAGPRSPVVERKDPRSFPFLSMVLFLKIEGLFVVLFACRVLLVFVKPPS
jgi:hypothetical protein